MRARVAMAAAFLALAAPLDAGAQAPSGGSRVPCAVPLAWRVARVDSEFGLSSAEVATVLGEAAALWEERAGRTLFRHDDENGFPVRLVYDERQARTDDRDRRADELSAERGRLDAEGEELKRQGDRHAAARARYADHQREYDQRVEAHNADVRAWNEGGGGSPDEGERLEAVSRALAEERGALEAERRALERDLRALQDEVDGVNRANAEHARREDAFAREFPAVTMEAGEYREAVRMEDGRVASVGREIRVYRFASKMELRLIFAHELGHALGLGHLDDPGAVMSAAHDVRAEGSVVTSVHASDLELLLATCPGLRGASGR